MINMTNGYGNGSVTTVIYTPNFTEETTCAPLENLTIEVANTKFKTVQTWNLTVNHTNSPLQKLTSIPDITQTGSVTLNLSQYFYDLDIIDGCHKQNVSFSYTQLSASGNVITAVLTDWINGINPSATFSSPQDGTANYVINAHELNEGDNSLIQTVNSNNFTIHITAAQQTSTGGSGSGGSSGSSTSSSKRSGGSRR